MSPLTTNTPSLISLPNQSNYLLVSNPSYNKKIKIQKLKNNFDSSGAIGKFVILSMSKSTKYQSKHYNTSHKDIRE